jgi:tRNA modification GTPase
VSSREIATRIAGDATRRRMAARTALGRTAASRGALDARGRRERARGATKSAPGRGRGRGRERRAATTDDDTIVGVATAVVGAVGGVAIVRLSGSDARAIGGRVFRRAGGATRASASANAANAFDESHKATYGVVVDGDGEIIDEVIALTFIAPRSYTAEDVVELHCHGGAVCVQRAMARCLDEGARLARNGEFTLRAFLNGRLDLTQAEAVHALVSAKTTAAADSALAAMRGGLTTPVSEARRACVDLLAELEARLDFDDEMVPLDVRAIEAKAAGARETIRKVLTTAKRGALLETGVTVAIVGRPNVGKSRLLNALTRSERSIVTSREGTTRDVVEASVNIGGLPATLLDTAGIRSETDDEVEKIGVERSRAAAAGADIVVLVVDAERGWVSEDSAIWQSEIANNARARGSSVLVVNKTDIADASNATPPPEVLESFSTVVHVSAATGDNLEHLEHAIVRTVSGGEVDAEGGAWAANQRQAEALQNALDSLDRLRDTIAADMPLDFWTIDLREAAFALGSVTGDDVTEDVLDTIFERFCIGK